MPQSLSQLEQQHSHLATQLSQLTEPAQSDRLRRKIVSLLPP